MSPSIDEFAARPTPFRVNRVEVRRVSIPMVEPFRISSGEVGTKDAILVRLEDETGASGWGESSAMPAGFYSAETPDSCERELSEQLAPALRGRGFQSMLDLEKFLVESGASRFSTVAIEGAAWEMAARRAGVSLRRLFGLADRPVPSGLAVGLYESPQALCDAIRRFRYERYKRLKIKIKQGQDIELVKAVREMLPGFPLFVDANADYDIGHLEIFRELDRFGLTMFEQPFAGSDLEGLAELQRHVRTPICIDESGESAAQVQRAIELDAARIVNIKLQRVGGFLEAFRIIEVAKRHGIPVWMGTMPELAVGSVHAITLASHPQFAWPTDVEPSSRWYVDDLVTPEITLREGWIDIPEGGYCVDPAKLERYTIRTAE